MQPRNCTAGLSSSIEQLWFVFWCLCLVVFLLLPCVPGYCGMRRDRQILCNSSPASQSSNSLETERNYPAALPCPLIRINRRLKHCQGEHQVITSFCLNKQ